LEVGEKEIFLRLEEAAEEVRHQVRRRLILGSRRK